MKVRKSAFTVDVEDGISLAMLHDFGVESPQTDRVVTHTRTILRLLDEYNTLGTFFILGKVAEDFPGLVREIAAGGHELGVHGYHHYQFFKMTREQAYEEISRAKKLIEDISGHAVLGHRAPAFSIMPETEWGLDVIAKAGFRYDSSIMPMKGRRYGWPGFGHEIRKINTKEEGPLIEVPMSVTSVMGMNIPICGGGYMRLFPYRFTQKRFEHVASQRPVIHYMHPYELDTERYPDYYFEQLNKSSLKKRLRMRSMWWNRKSVYGKLSRLLQSYPFGTMKEVILAELGQNSPVH